MPVGTVDPPVGPGGRGQGRGNAAPVGPSAKSGHAVVAGRTENRSGSTEDLAPDRSAPEWSTPLHHRRNWSAPLSATGRTDVAPSKADPPWEEADGWAPRLVPATSCRAHRRHPARGARPERPGRGAGRSLTERTGARSAAVDIRMCKKCCDEAGSQSRRGRETRPRRADHAGLVSPVSSSAVLWR